MSRSCGRRVHHGGDHRGPDESRRGRSRGAQRECALKLGGRPCRLTLHWLTDYAGGLLIMFRDTTSGDETSGSGRYLIDTAKGADLGGEGGRLVLDFNFAYQPSCSYDASWNCPVAPRENWLEVPVRAGERIARVE